MGYTSRGGRRELMAQKNPQPSVAAEGVGVKSGLTPITHCVLEGRSDMQSHIGPEKKGIKGGSPMDQGPGTVGCGGRGSVCFDGWWQATRTRLAAWKKSLQLVAAFCARTLRRDSFCWGWISLCVRFFRDVVSLENFSGVSRGWRRVRHVHQCGPMESAAFRRTHILASVCFGAKLPAERRADLIVNLIGWILVFAGWSLFAFVAISLSSEELDRRRESLAVPVVEPEQTSAMHVAVTGGVASDVE